MQVKVRAFAGLREALGFTEATLELAPGAQVDDVLARLGAEHPAAGLAERHFSLAVNRAFARGDQLLNDGDELALIPPVSGG